MCLLLQGPCPQAYPPKSSSIRLSKSIALPSLGLYTLGLLSSWIRPPPGQLWRSLATHGVMQTLEPAPPQENNRNLGCHPRRKNLDFLQQSCLERRTPRSCCSRDFAPKASSTMNSPCTDCHIHGFDTLGLPPSRVRQPRAFHLWDWH
jgi:hypothetical protein